MLCMVFANPVGRNIWGRSFSCTSKSFPYIFFPFIEKPSHFHRLEFFPKMSGLRNTKALFRIILKYWLFQYINKIYPWFSQIFYLWSISFWNIYITALQFSQTPSWVAKKSAKLGPQFASTLIIFLPSPEYVENPWEDVSWLVRSCCFLVSTQCFSATIKVQ
jgi:hypothetical protein